MKTLLEMEDTGRRLDSLPGDQLVHLLQYEVREGREAGEVVVIPKAFIAKRNSSFILLGRVEDEVQVQGGGSNRSEEHGSQGCLEF